MRASEAKKLRLGAFVPGAGQHIVSWRHPDQPADGNTNFEFYRKLVETAERGLFDAYFFADTLVVGGGRERKGGLAKFAVFEPLTLCAALAPFTKHLGFIATATTEYEEPYNTARKFASLDLISGGRAGWNVVTSAGDGAAQNYGHEHQRPSVERYQRAAEYVDVVKKLWGSLPNAAFIRNKQTGEFFDPSKVLDINHDGQFFKVKGPLNVPQSPQGYPVIVQAGSSNEGRDLAASIAEVVFTAHDDLEGARQFYSDICKRAEAFGRSKDDLLVMPGLCPFIGRTEDEARSKYEALNSFISPEEGIANLNLLMGHTLEVDKVDLDGPLPPPPQTEGFRSRQTLLWRIAEKNGFSIRQLYQWVATARGHLTLIGTPTQIADVMEEWLHREAADGFNIIPPWVPTGFEDFVNMVVPELQRRNIFRTAYEGTTLRENLGLKNPVG